MLASVSLEIAENQSLAPWTTLGLGGESRWYTRVTSEEQVLEALGWAKSKQVEWMLLGDGSNVVVGDRGFAGLTLHMATEGIEVQEQGDDVFVTAQAGEAWDPLVAMSTRRGWSGIECLSGIPGRVGATPIQNVGAYGQEVSETIASVRVYDAAHQQITDWSTDDCAFSYRDSVFKRSPPGRYVVLSVCFRLRKQGAPTVLYGELSRALTGIPIDRGVASLESVRETVLSLRRAKAMVVDPGDPNSRSAGSFFTNPVVTAKKADELAKQFPAMPRFPIALADGTRHTKLAAAWLIEKSGFEKGLRRGPVGISEKHALALVHYGEGTSQDLLALAQEIREGVYRVFGLTLEPEPRLVGCDLPRTAQSPTKKR